MLCGMGLRVGNYGDDDYTNKFIVFLSYSPKQCNNPNFTEITLPKIQDSVSSVLFYCLILFFLFLISALFSVNKVEVIVFEISKRLFREVILDIVEINDYARL